MTKQANAHIPQFRYRGAFYLEGAPHFFHPFPHRRKAHALGKIPCIKPRAVIAYRKANHLWRFAPQFYRHFCGLAMSGGIGQGFLRDSREAERRFGAKVPSCRVIVRVKFYNRAGSLGKAADMPPQRFR